jgi:peroxiredoxin
LDGSKSPPRSLAEVFNEAEEQNVTLGARLAAYRAGSARLRPDIARAYDELIARLELLDSGGVGPPIGAPMPEFWLPDERGKIVSLSELLRSGPAVISFNRGHWCPYCKLELRALAGIHDEIARLGAKVVSIMPDSARFTQDYADKNRLPFPVLSDIDLGYALSLGLIFWVGTEIQRLYRDAGVELETYQDNGGAFLPMAAKFIVSQDGLVKARQVNIEFRERMAPETVLAELRALKAA